MPKVYRVFRETARVIGDDSNLIREFSPMPGRVLQRRASAPTASGSPPAAASTATAR